MLRHQTLPLSGWGHYPVEVARLYRPETQTGLAALLRSGLETSYIARGLGRSYGTAALNATGGVVLQTRLNRLLSFATATGVVECEAGATIADLLACFLPLGFFPPVTPGTKFVTMGGAIANDVHGKNHHRDGSFAKALLDFRLLTAAGDVIRCSRTENADLFWATVGGLGLTGMILTARLQLRRVESAYLTVDSRRAADFTTALNLLSTTEADYQYSVAWIDCLARGNSLGRSVVMLGNHAPASDIAGRAPLPAETPVSGSLTVPFSMPSGLLNPYTVGAFNSLYYRRFRTERRIVHYEPFFYPLDRLRHWNRLYGAAGFVQYQAVIPRERAEAGLQALLERLSRSGLPSFLAVLKGLGSEGQGLLSFPRPGFTLALDLPVRGERLFRLLADLDQVVLAHGGRIYLAKDAALDPAHLGAMYPRLPHFRTIKQQVDPNGRFHSSLARRLGIVEEA